VEWLQDNHDWPCLTSIGKVTSTVVKKGKETKDTRYYLSSLPLTAEQFNDVARSHLGIENKLHWRLDVVFNEDKACIRNDHAAKNMTILRKWALGILQKAKTKPEQSLKSIMRRNAMYLKHLLNCVNKIIRA
jgi:predicted transposase YbfD/YdcC